MSKTFCYLAVSLLVLSLPYLSSAQVGDSGNVTVNVRTTDVTNNGTQIITRRVSQTLPFYYNVSEWNSGEEVLADTEWFYEPDGEDTWELRNNYGDVIDLIPPTGIDVPAVLAIIATTNAGDNQTIADTIGFSVSQAVTAPRNVAQANNNTNVAVTVPDVTSDIQNAAADAQNYIQNATQNALANIDNAAAGAVAGALLPAVLVDNAYRDALQNLQNSYNNAIANLSNAYNNAKARVAVVPQNAAADVQQGVENLAENVQNLPENASQGAIDIANNAGEQLGAAVGDTQGAVENVQNAAQNVQDAFNSGFNSEVGGQ